MSPICELTTSEVLIIPLGLVYLYPNAVLVLFTASGRGVTIPTGVKAC